jgi:hypothetical protein
MSPKDIENLRRIVFFEGSYIMTGREIPYMDNFPFALVGNKNGSLSAHPGTPEMANGDYMTVTGLQAKGAPEALALRGAQDDAHTLAVDLRCASCNSAFDNVGALLSHCKMTGHEPQRVVAGAEPCNFETLMTFCNVALQRAMGERMARWGKEYIDPKNWEEPKDKQGRSLGVRIFRAYVS